jgi:hypothetical protein
MLGNKHHEEIEEYGDPGILSADAKVPSWLKWTYFILPIWGIISFSMFWNGSHGWWDRGYWHQLQRAANTTFPYINEDDPTLKRLKNDAVPPEFATGKEKEQPKTY